MSRKKVASPATTAALSVPTPLSPVFCVPSGGPGEGGPYVLLSPLELAARALAPGQLVLVRAAGAGGALACAAAWPAPRGDRGHVGLPCVHVLPLARAPAAPGRGEAPESRPPPPPAPPASPAAAALGAAAAPPASPAAAALVVVEVEPAARAPAGSLAPAATLYVCRGSGAAGTPAGAPLAALRRVLLGAAMPAGGGVVTWPALAPAGGALPAPSPSPASASAHLTSRPTIIRLLPRGADGRALLDAGVTCVYVDARTRFIDGPPPSAAPRRAAADDAPGAVGVTQAPGERGGAPAIGGLDAEAAELAGLLAAALAAPLAREQQQAPQSPSAPAAGRPARPPPRPARGALLHGPPGTGKTLLARAAAAAAGVRLSVVDGADVLAGAEGEPEAALRRAFEGADGGVLLLDEVDALAPDRGGGGGGGGGGGASARLTSALLALMDGVNDGDDENDGGENNDGGDKHGAAGGSAGGGGAARTPPSVRVVTALDLPYGLLGAAAAPLRRSLAPAGRRRPRPLFVLGTTNRPGALDAALRRPGRFDREIALPVPSARAREDILAACLRGYPAAVPAADARALAARMHGYVGADIAAVCREGAAAALRRVEATSPASAGDIGGGPGGGGGGGGVDAATDALGRLSIAPGGAAAPAPAVDPSSASGGALAVTPADLLAGLRAVQPSALREVAVDVPAVSWSDIAGQAAAKAALAEAVEWPAAHAAAFAVLGLSPPRGVLLYGPPGCSKTMMARAMATGGGMNFIGVKGPELLSKFVGDSEKAVAEVFARARAAAPCVVFFDEFDALAPRREGGGEGGGGGGGASVAVRVVSQLLTELDGVSPRRAVVVVAATNRPDLVDPALLRPGRVDRLLYVGLPDAPARAALLAARLARVPHAVEPADAAALAADGGPLDGRSGAEIVGVLREAALLALADADADDAAAAAGGGSGAGERRGGGGGGGADARVTAANVRAAAAAAPRGVTPEMLAFYDRLRGQAARA